MRLRMIAIALGIASVSVLPVLPPPFILLAAVPLLVLIALYRQPLFSLLIFSLLGMLWGTGFGHGLLAAQLPAELEGVDLWLQGSVTGLPVHSALRGEPVQRFDLNVDSPLCVDTKGFKWLPTGNQLPVSCVNSVKRMRLSWYGQGALKPGQRWRLLVRAKRPHGMANPGGFDYQAWLVQRGIGAVGTVQQRAENILLEEHPYALDRLRWDFSRYLDHQLSGLAGLPVFKALLIGDKRAISTSQWQLFARTGTTHLMVISGLHVGLISALAFGLGRLLSLLLCPRLAAERSGAVLAICVAVVYSAAAGFSLPTQRALLMLTVWMATVFYRRHLAPGQGLVMALVVCLLFDPLAPIGLSFWLSFAAVAVIFYSSSGRHQGSLTIGSRYLSHYRAQYWVFIGLLPVLAMLLGRISLLSPVANLLAVPVFSLVIVPLNLLAAIVAVVNSEAGIYLWQWLDYLLGYVMGYLASIDQALPDSVLIIPQLPWLATLLALVAALLLLLPRGMPLRGFGWLLLLPMVWVKPLAPQAGEVIMTVLDVGQGLSVVVQTRGHTLVYDVGPAFSEDFNAASTALIPYLQHRGIDKIDRLILSHGDNDHAGGWASVVERLPVASLLYGQALPGFDQRSSPCIAGQQWQWDNVHFAILHPSPGAGLETANATISANNRSCVLTITTARQRFLLPGDIEQSVEHQLVKRLGQRLAATVLIAPHHGSATSSTWAFIKQVQPQHVVFASGYRNKFGHPKPQILKRYRQMGSELHHSSRHGAITFQTDNGELLTVTHYRQQNPRYWR